MSELSIAAIFLAYGAFVGAWVSRIPAYDRSELTSLYGSTFIALATVGAFGSLGLLIYDYGALSGFAHFVALSFIIAIVNIPIQKLVPEGLASLLGLVALFVGFYLSWKALN